MKNQYKKLMVFIIDHLNLINHRKSFFLFFNEIYDEFAQLINLNKNKMNENILIAIQKQIKLLREKIECVPTTLRLSPSRNLISSPSRNLFNKSRIDSIQKKDEQS